MKKFNFLLTSIFSLTAGALISCSLISEIKNYEMPQKVSINTTGKYTVPLGDATARFRDHFSAKALQELIDKNIQAGSEGQSYSLKDVHCYEYADNSGIQKYIFDYSVADVPLDISEYFSNIEDLNRNALSQKLCREFKIPELGNLDFSQDKGIDFNELISDSFKSSVVLRNVPESGTEAVINWDPVDFSITSPDFKYLEFKEGNIELTFTADPSSTPSQDYVVQAKAECYDSAGNLVSTSGDSYVTVISGSTTGSKLILPVDSKKITSNLSINFSTKVNGGEEIQAGHLNSYNISISLSDNAKISSVKGLTIPDSELETKAIDLNKTVDTTALSSRLKSGVIEEGSITYLLKVPDSWSGITAEPVIDMTGGLIIKNENFKSISAGPEYIAYKTQNLKDTKIFPDGPKDIEIQGSVPFHVKNADIELHYDSEGAVKDVITFDAVTKITKVRDARIYMGNVINFDELPEGGFDRILDDNITDFIKCINFTKISLEGNIDTNLPASDLQLNVHATADKGILEGLDMSDKVLFDGDVPYKMELENIFNEDLLDSETGLKGKTSVLDTGARVAIKFDLNVSGGDPVEKDLIKFSSITLGETYTLNFDIKLNYDWYSVVLNTNSVNLSGNTVAGLDIGNILGHSVNSEEVVNDILNKVKFKSEALEGKIYVLRPDLPGMEEFDGLTGWSKLKYGGKSDYIFPESGSSGTIEFLTARKSLADIADENNVIYEQDFRGIPASADLKASALVDMFNDKPEKEELEYEMTISSRGKEEIVIKKDDLEKLKEADKTTSITISMAMILSLELNISDDIVINDTFGVFGAGIEDDLLGRSKAGEKSDYEEYTKLIKGIYLDYIVDNQNTGLNIKTSFSARDESDTEYLYKEMIMGKNDRLLFNSNDIQSMFDNYPFIPKVGVTFEKGDVTVRSTAAIRIKAALTAETDGNYAIWEKGGK